MSLAPLFEVLSALYPLSDRFKRALENEITVLSLPKNYLLLEAPAVAPYVHFLNDGFAMSYTFVKGEKKVSGFWGDSQIVVSLKSFFEQTPSTEFIQLMVQSEVFFISRPSLLMLLDNFPEGNCLCRKIMHIYYEQCRSRLHDIQWLTATERYLKLRHHFPGIEQVISQEDIASYLSIVPQSLSRIKKRLSKA